MSKPMHILVTGATSPTGSLVVRALMEKGHTIRCLVRTEAKRRFLPASGIAIMQGDLEKPETLDAAFAGIDLVAHIAHIRYAATIIEACNKAGVRRAIFFSSTRRFTRFDCLTARQVRDGESRIEASSLDYTLLRPSMIYGSRRDNNISRLVQMLRRCRVFPLVGDGKNLVQPVYTRDVVDALLSAIECQAAVRSVYTLAGPSAMTYREMIQTIGEALGRKIICLPVPTFPILSLARLCEVFSSRPRITADQIRRMGEDRAFDIGPARRDLNFSPVEFAEGVRRQIAGEVDAFWKEPSSAKNET